MLKHTQTQAQTHSCSNTHTQTHRLKHTRSSPQVQTHTYSNIHTCKHTRKHTRSNIHTHTSSNTHTLKHTGSHTLSNTHSNTHTKTHRLKHTHTLSLKRTHPQTHWNYVTWASILGPRSWFQYKFSAFFSELCSFQGNIIFTYVKYKKRNSLLSGNKRNTNYNRPTLHVTLWKGPAHGNEF